MFAKQRNETLAVGLQQAAVVLGGSFTLPSSADTGDSFHADYGPLGSIAFRIV